MAIDNATAKRYGIDQPDTDPVVKYAALLIPQKLEVPGTKKTMLNVTYTITNPGGVQIQETQSFELVKQVEFGSSNVISEWVEGKRYTYTLTFGLDEIYLAPAVDNWDDVDAQVNSDITI